MKNLKEYFKNSFFFVNKIYKLLIFLLLTIEDFSLGFYYFIFSLIVYIYNILTSKVPIEVKTKVKEKTYIYKRTKDKDLKLDLWSPENNNSKSPLVFFCHGGGWVSGFRNQPNNVSWCKYLVEKGFSVVSIDYRFGLKNTMEDILSDYTDALDFVKENDDILNIDKNNIILMGLSAGAHLSLLYSTYFTFNKNLEKMLGIKAIVAYYAPSDLKDVFISENKSLFAKFGLKKTIDNENDKTEKTFSKDEIYQYYSPLTWVSKNMIPCLLVHGKEDTVIPYKSSLKMYKKLKDNKVPVTLLTHKTAGHVFDTNNDDKKTIEILIKTIDYMKNMTRGD